MKHLLGKFRLSVTADPRDLMGDGQVGAKWTVLHPSAARTLSTETLLQIGKDGTILAAAEQVPDFDCYYVEAGNPLGAGVTGFRLEALPDDSLPAGGPGMAPGGNFVLGEINIRTWRPN